MELEKPKPGYAVIGQLLGDWGLKIQVHKKFGGQQSLVICKYRSEDCKRLVFNQVGKAKQIANVKITG